MSEHPTNIGLRLENTDQYVAESKCIEVKKKNLSVDKYTLFFVSNQQRCKQIKFTHPLQIIRKSSVLDL